MKFIGQHIVDLIARFRSDVYLDSPTAGDSDPDKFLALDTNKKIVYRTGTQVASDIGASTSDLTVSNLAASTLVIESEGIGSNDNDTTLPTSAAVKDYADRPAKGIKIYHANFKDNMGTTEHFIPLAGVPDEQHAAAKEQTVVIMPCAGAVKEIILRMHWSSAITTSDDITWKTYVRTKEKRMNGSGSVSGTFTMTNPTQGISDDDNTRSSGEITHAFAEGDAVSISMQWANTGPTNSADRIYVTVVMEMDYSSFGY